MSSSVRSVPTRPRALPAASVTLTVMLAVALLAGCGAVPGTPGGSGEDGRRAVASFYPLAWLTEQVAGEEWTVTNLTTPGGEPHDLELGIAETAAVEQADLVVFESGLQPAVDEAVGAVGDAAVLDAAEVVQLRPLEEHDHDHEGDDHGHDHGHDHEGHDHGEPGDPDPHFWLDPLLMADLADAVADRLAELDPAGSSAYAANAAAVREDLEALDAAYTRGLAACEREVVVVSHAAFGYLSRYGLHFEAIAGLSPDAEPTPADIARLQQLIREEGVTTVFSERLASPAMAQSLARDTGVRTAVLDPVEGPADAGAEADYRDLMEANLEALRRANGCR